ncbi:hypothetical protein HPQ64_12770 [Rhizobiales bacterium]|uniref:hypothetical protein n=1 Tax=Hongsoonwoonella zoysiae TaxID=2821844 RepID=UPI00155F9475|nr:hypothetical protein [Hongsoonwoonella zoysiae]NRG18563.1 hypothetical protein [Hongsoonwoonella zoysiae]
MEPQGRGSKRECIEPAEGPACARQYALSGGLPDGEPIFAERQAQLHKRFVRSIFPAAAGLERWDDDGGASDHDSEYSIYGRRIEGDGTWTIYHVFTGVPATIGGQVMKGLNAADSMTRTMLTNSDNSRQRKASRPEFPVEPVPAGWRLLLKGYFGRFIHRRSENRNS